MARLHVAILFFLSLLIDEMRIEKKQAYVTFIGILRISTKKCNVLKKKTSK